MKSWSSGMLVALLISAPLAAGQNINASANADVSAVNSMNLGLMQIGEAFGDFVFRIKSVLTFDENAKLDLLKSRNEEMKARQSAWLDIKSSLLEQARSGNITAEERQQLIKYLRAEHESIIKEHLRLTTEVRKVQLSAKSGRNHEVEKSAELEADESEKSELSSGLNISGDIGLVIGLAENMTAEEAKALAEERLGFQATEVRTETRNGATFYVVSGEENSTAGNYTLRKGFEMWVRPNTGVIESLGMNAKLESTAGIGA